MYRIGWFSTGRDEAARDLLRAVWDSIKEGQIRAEIAFVFSNREPGEAGESDLFFDLVKSYRLPLLCFSSRRFRVKERRRDKARWRLEYDREVMRRLKNFSVDLCVLAGYMLVLGPELCQRYPMINLHPARPGGPTGTWQEVIWKLIEDRASESGVTMHLVTPELDQGPPVTCCTFSLRDEPFDRYWAQLKKRSLEQVKASKGADAPLFRLIRQHGLVREFPLMVATLKAFSEGRVRIEGARVVSAKGEVLPGYDLTQEINQALEESRR